LQLKNGLESISRHAAKNNGLCEKAINNIEAFSAEYHKSGNAIKNMGRIAFGKEPVDTAKENGKLAAAVSAPYRTAKSVWAKIERVAFVLARDLSDFHTRTQIARDNRHEAKETDKTQETAKTQKTDVFKTVEKHKETAGTAKDKPREARKKKDER
jgi:hypothetical protein